MLLSDCLAQLIGAVEISNAGGRGETLLTGMTDEQKMIILFGPGSANVAYDSNNEGPESDAA